TPGSDWLDRGERLAGDRRVGRDREDFTRGRRRHRARARCRPVACAPAFTCLAEEINVQIARFGAQGERGMKRPWGFSHLGLKLLSFGMALLLWMVVSGEETVERGLRVPLELQQVPT